MSKYERLARLMKITILIKFRKNLNRRDLAEEFAVSTRTIQRDITSLNYAGVPIFWADDGYKIMPDFFLESVNLTFEEILYLTITAKASCECRGEPYKKNVNSALLKIIASLPDRIREQIEEVMKMADLKEKSYSQILEEVEELICELRLKSPV